MIKITKIRSLKIEKKVDSEKISYMLIYAKSRLFFPDFCLNFMFL